MLDAVTLYTHHDHCYNNILYVCIDVSLYIYLQWLGVGLMLLYHNHCYNNILPVCIDEQLYMLHLQWVGGGADNVT